MPAAAYNPKRHSIFKATHHVCTACVGENGIGDFETYATGYFEATQLLLVQVLDLKQGLTQDTLVYPILFTLRHGVELSIKHLARVLIEAGLPHQADTAKTHELKQLWSDFSKQAVPDRRLIAAISELEPAVLQMHEADPLAQEFRYAERTDGVPSFKGHSVVDMVTVRELASFTAKRFSKLFWLADQIRRERQYGSFTPELNRVELEQLSKELPAASQWAGSEQFEAVKATWIKKYQLSNRAFSRAVDFIKGHREFAGNIGQPKPFVALTEDAIDRLLSASLKLLSEQTKKTPKGRPMEPRFDRPSRTKLKSTRLELTVPLVAEVNALFYLGRDGVISEQFEAKLEYHSRYTEPVSVDVLWPNFAHVFEKMNFAKCMCRGLRMTGHSMLAAKFEPEIERLYERYRRTSAIHFP